MRKSLIFKLWGSPSKPVTLFLLYIIEKIIYQFLLSFQIFFIKIKIILEIILNKIYYK